MDKVSCHAVTPLTVAPLSVMLLRDLLTTNIKQTAVINITRIRKVTTMKK